MSYEISIAVLITCHNRVDTTLRCLRCASSQIFDSVPVRLDFIVVDDGSSDGTGEAIARTFPNVKIITGDGNLFWCGGMRRAFDVALQGRYDFYLWLNDDTVLRPDALANLLMTYSAVSDGCTDGAHIVVGSTDDPVTGLTTYSGWRSTSKMVPLSCRMIEPDSKPLRCDTMNGNCVLISKKAAEIIGNLDNAFTHSMGDFDYGFRAVKAGCLIWLSPGHVGTCVPNSGQGLWTGADCGLLERWARLLGKKGLPPREWLMFTRRHCGPFWPLYWINPYTKLLIYSIFPFKRL